MKLRAITLLSACLLAGWSASAAAQSGPVFADSGNETDALASELPPPSIDVWDRIRAGFQIPNLDSSLVDSHISSISRAASSFAKTSERAGLYLYYIVGEVEARGMPMEIALLPFVESAFQPTALSGAKASGLWQFIPSTGTQYSLDQNLWKDERRDVIESTRAALDYFEKLYAMFGDWQLALASYNWGEGNVQRALERNRQQGLPEDYAHIRMPRETANYVPRLEAVKKIVQNPGAYGVTLPDIGSEPYFVQIFRDKDIDTRTAARLAGVKTEEFRLLNPGFNKPVIVGSHDNAMLLPADNLDAFMENLAVWRSNGKRVSSWRTHRFQKGESLTDIAESTGMTLEELKSVNRIPDNRRVADNSLLLVRADADEPRAEIDGSTSYFRLEPVPSVPKIRYRQIRYRVRKGDTVESIASRLNVTSRSIISANRLRSPKLRAGQSLTLTVPVIQRAPDIARISREKAEYRASRRYRLKAAPPAKSASRSSSGKKGTAARSQSKKTSSSGKAGKKAVSAAKSSASSRSSSRVVTRLPAAKKR